MSAVQLLAWLSPSCKSSRFPLQIYENIEFRELFKQQRALADRGSHGFSLAVFDFAKDVKGTEQQVTRLAEILRARARLTDAVGLLGNTQLGVLLPETSFHGARQFADEIQRVMLKKGLRPSACHVFSYPLDEASSLRKAGQREQWPSAFLSPEDGSSSMGISPGTDRPERVPDFQCVSVPDNGGSLPQGLDAFLSLPLPQWKRTIDLIGALAGLVLLSPVFLFVAVLIKVVSPGPVFFYQERVGYLGHHFRVWKFRTMQVDEDGALHQQHVIGLIRDEKPLTKLDQGVDKRIIPFGKLLRLTGIDELPQLVNVLRGEMSLVGPRPDVPYAVDEYLCWNKARFDAVPGLTGLWQVSGKNRTTHSEMMRLDIRYAHTRSFWLDVKILARTIPAVLRQLKDHRSGRDSSASSK